MPKKCYCPPPRRSVDENTDTPTQSSDFENPVLQNNALSFNSGDDFRGFIHELQKQPDDKLNKFVKNKVNGFKSLKQARDNITDDFSKAKQKEILQLNIEDPNFASVVNQNGVFQIDGRVFKITNQHTYIFKNRAAFEAFDAPKNKLSHQKLKPCGIDREVTRVRDDVYQVENCGGYSGGGYSSGESKDDNYTDPDVENLDIYANLQKDYPAKRTETYRSGGTRGRLKGKSWSQNFYVYSSFGAKSVHERYTWLRWRNRDAEEISLQAFAEYSFGENKISFLDLEKSFDFKVKDVIKTIQSYQFDPVSEFLQDVRSLSDHNSKIVRYGYDLVSNYEYKITVTKTKTRGEEFFTYEIVPENLSEFFPFTTVKNERRIRKTFNVSTAVFAYPPAIKQAAVEFEIDIIRAKHTLKHNGYHLGFITDKRE